MDFSDPNFLISIVDEHGRAISVGRDGTVVAKGFDGDFMITHGYRDGLPALSSVGGPGLPTAGSIIACLEDKT